MGDCGGRARIGQPPRGAMILYPLPHRRIGCRQAGDRSCLGLIPGERRLQTLEVRGSYRLGSRRRHAERIAIAERLHALGIRYGQGSALGGVEPLASTLAELYYC